MSPTSELTLTIRPSPWRRMTGRAALIIRTTPKKLVSNCSLACSMLVPSDSPERAKPALLTRASMRPARPRSASTHALTEASERTSRTSISTPAGAPSGAALRLVPKTR